MIDEPDVIKFVKKMLGDFLIDVFKINMRSRDEDFDEKIKELVCPMEDKLRECELHIQINSKDNNKTKIAKKKI